jgi:hypothetical protein
VPAVAALGAVAAAPHIYGLAVSTTPAGHNAGSDPAGAARVSPAGSARLTPGASSASPDSLTARQLSAARAAATVLSRKLSPPARHAGRPASASTAGARQHRPATHQAVARPACSAGASGLLPENYATIFSFLTGHGYTPAAAAGIEGNIYQESKGDPESAGSGGGGLIGWTPLPPGFVTGNAAADLRTQLNALLTFDEQQAQYIPALNAAASPAQAAAIYMNDFERPGFPQAGNREAAAEAVAAACGHR